MPNTTQFERQPYSITSYTQSIRVWLSGLRLYNDSQSMSSADVCSQCRAKKLITHTAKTQQYLTKVVSQSSLLPCIRLPIVMLKYVVPLLQLDILVNGYTARISCNSIDNINKCTDRMYFVYDFYNKWMAIHSTTLQ